MLAISKTIAFVFALLVCGTAALAPQKGGRTARRLQQAADAPTRRNVLATTMAAVLTTVGSTQTASADTGAEVRGTAVTPFNGLAFQYRGSDFAGLTSADIDEPSVSYQDFMQRLKTGQVKFVEFLARDGDKAYATFVSADGKTEAPIRIGAGESS